MSVLRGILEEAVLSDWSSRLGDTWLKWWRHGKGILKHAFSWEVREAHSFWIFFWTLSWPVTFSLRSLLFEKKILSVSINMACLVCCRTAGPTQNCFLPETELKTMLSWPHCSVDRHQEIPLPALPSSIIPWPRPRMEMVSKLHQVIPWWLPTVLLSQTQSQMTGPKNLLQTFLQRERLLVLRGSAFLAFKFTGKHPWWRVLLDSLGLP